MTQPVIGQHKQQKVFLWEFGNRKAMKIVVLIKISKLPITITQITTQQFNSPFILKTPHGQLTKQYQIIYYIINQSKQQAGKSNLEIAGEGQDNSGKVINLSGQDAYINARMSQKLFQLRGTLFPLLDQFYKYLFGHQRTKKAKYDSLINKIKKQIAQLDANINQCAQMFYKESCYLNVIISCQMFFICSLVFQEKFRKSKYFLFNMYQKTSTQSQFKEMFGKANFTAKEYIPQDFEEEEHLPPQQQEIIPLDIKNIADGIINMVNQPQRNNLLYNFFKSVFTQNQSKKNYFPYFWMMFDSLHCCLIQLVDSTPDLKYEFTTQRTHMLQLELDKILRHDIDYGIIGVYHQEKDKKYLIRVLICLGSKSYQDFELFINSSHQLKDYKLHKIDINNNKQKKQVQIIWEHTIENTCYQDVNVCMITYI